MEMKKVLQNNKKTKAFLEKLPKIYVVACWAGFGIMELPFAGKYDADGIPYVWQYEDFNGQCDEYRLRRLDCTTTGRIYAWTTSREAGLALADAMNARRKEEWRIPEDRKSQIE